MTMVTKHKHFFELLFVFLIVVLAFGYFAASYDWNTNTRMAMVKAVVDENRFEIDSYHRLPELFTFDKARVDGRFYSDKAIGSSLIGIVFYTPISFFAKLSGNVISLRVFKEVVTFLAIGLICAFLAPLMYSLVKRISNSSRWALLITAIVCLGTPFYKYSTAYYGHPLAALFLFVAFFIWFHIKDEDGVSLVKCLISGYLLAFAIITEFPVALMAGGIGLYILFILWQKKRLFDVKIYGCLLIGAALPILVTLVYNNFVFGGPFKTGYEYEVLTKFVKGQSGGLMGIGKPSLHTLFYMTFHKTMGIFWQCPVLLLSFLGWFRMWQGGRYRAEAILTLGLVVTYSLLMSGYYLWWGGGAFTPRSLIPIYPFFVIPLIFLRGRVEKILLIVLAFVSIGQMFIVVAAKNSGLYIITHERYMKTISIRSMFAQASTIYDIFLQNFMKQLIEVNRGQEFFNLTGFASLIPLLVGELLLLLGFMKITSSKKENV